MNKKIYKTHKYLEKTKINLYWVIIIVLAIAGEVILLEFYFPNGENGLLTGIMFLIWSLIFYIYRKLIIIKLSKDTNK